jgi:hypothetical protein
MRKGTFSAVQNDGTFLSCMALLVNSCSASLVLDACFTTSQIEARPVGESFLVIRHHEDPLDCQGIVDHSSNGAGGFFLAREGFQYVL